MRREQRQQLIVQDFDFAHRPVADVNLERTIVRPQRQRRMFVVAPFPQMQNVGLQPVQQIVARRFDKAVPLDARVALQQVDEIPPLLAQRSQQRMTDRQIFGFVGSSSSPSRARSRSAWMSPQYS